MQDAVELTVSAAGLLEWLAHAPSRLNPSDLPAARVQLARLDRLPQSDAQYLAILAQFDERITSLVALMRPELHRTTLPLTHEQRGRSRDLSDVLGQLATCHYRLLAQTPSAESAMRALRALYRRLEVSALGGLATPSLLWLTAHETYLHLGHMAQAASEYTQRARLLYFRMLAVGSAQPQRLSASEIGDMVDWLDASAVVVSLHARRPVDADESWFWIDMAEDCAPEQIGRRQPPARASVVVFSLAPLASHALAEAAQENVDSARDAGSPVVAGLMRRLADQWSAAHTRQLSRRPNNYRVALCTGLESIWRLLQYHSAGAAEAPELSEWSVLNESAGGYAIMHVGGHVEGIIAGGVVALRTGADDTWTVCLVRWNRNDNPEHIELGLQILSQGAQAVQIAFRSPKTRCMSSALLLPALPAVRPSFAMLAPAGSYTARRFVLVAQTERLYVAQGRVRSLDVQTASIELFQFELDPYPI